jgi:hypothetical protein
VDAKTSNVTESKGENMKRYTWPLFLAALVAFTLLAVHLSAQNDNAVQNTNSNGGLALQAITLSGGISRGVVFKTAAINTDGSVAGCFRCDKLHTVKISTGAYQVAFDELVQANQGWSRWVQVDTLSTGSENAWCTTADRSGDANAIYVQCQHEGGAGSMGNSVPVDTSFFIFVAR